jgi:hypothetical protein
VQGVAGLLLQGLAQRERVGVAQQVHLQAAGLDGPGEGVAELGGGGGGAGRACDQQAQRPVELQGRGVAAGAHAAHERVVLAHGGAPGRLAAEGGPLPGQGLQLGRAHLELDLHARAGLVGAAGHVDQQLAHRRGKQGAAEGQAEGLAVVGERRQLQGGVGHPAGGGGAQGVPRGAAAADRELKRDHRCLHNS